MNNQSDVSFQTATSDQSYTTFQPTFNNQSSDPAQLNVAIEEDGDISKEVADDVIFAIECVTMPILVVFGITGSLLSLIVLLQRSLRTSSTNVLLIGLAISDGMYLIATIIRKPTCIISRFDSMLSYKYFTLSFPVMFYTHTCFSRVSTLLITALSIERLIAVMWPLKVRLICTVKRMIGTMVFIFFFTFSVLTLLLVQYRIEYINDLPYIQLTEFYMENKEFFDIYNRFLSHMILRWIPKIIVVISNVIIITSLWKRRIPTENPENQNSVANYPKTQRKITVMLVTVAVVFVITLLPGDAFAIATHVVDGFALYGKYNNLFLVLSDITLTFEIVNSSINFIIYMLLNSTFQHVYLMLFCPCLSKSKRRRYINHDGLQAPSSTMDRIQESDGSRY